MAPIFWRFEKVIFDHSGLVSILICLFLAVAFVGSLYVKISFKYGRDHPESIKERFSRIFVVCVFVVPFLWFCSTSASDGKAQFLLTWLGLRFEGLLSAIVYPLLLTMILFLGPLYLHYLDGVFSLYADPGYWSAQLSNFIWLRNHIVAPFSEEFVFRACMLPILVPALGEWWSVVLCPFFFGVAHLHHIYEKIRLGVAWKRAVGQSVFQFTYTTVFGFYSAFIFLRTGHFIAPAIVHAFCNHMGFPKFEEIFGYDPPVRNYAIGAFILGVVLWYQLLYVLTTPSWYGNTLYNI